MIYTGFDVHRFRGVADASISLVKNDLILLLGLNESGKTTILRAIEAFDFRNDPNDASAMEAFYASIRNKSDEFSNESVVVRRTDRVGTTSKSNEEDIERYLDPRRSVTGKARFGRGVHSSYQPVQ